MTCGRAAVVATVAVAGGVLRGLMLSGPPLWFLVESGRVVAVVCVSIALLGWLRCRRLAAIWPLTLVAPSLLYSAMGPAVAYGEMPMNQLIHYASILLLLGATFDVSARLPPWVCHSGARTAADVGCSIALLRQASVLGACSMLCGWVWGSGLLCFVGLSLTGLVAVAGLAPLALGAGMGARQRVGLPVRAPGAWTVLVLGAFASELSRVPWALLLEPSPASMVVGMYHTETFVVMEVSVEVFRVAVMVLSAHLFRRWLAREPASTRSGSPGLR